MPANPSATPNAIDPLIRQALEWQVTLWSGNVSAEEHTAFQHWLAADARHHAAWQAAQRLHEKLAGLPPTIGAHALRTPPKPPTRRRVLAALGWLAGGGIALGTARQSPQWHIAFADHATRTGERRQITLADGSKIDLNTGSAIDVRFDATQRLITLREGEIRITTAPDPARPFIVRTHLGQVRALGTVFRLQQQAGQIRVAVFDGAVAIQPAHGTATRIDAGGQARFDATEVIDDGPADTNAIAWTRHQLVAERLRLADFIAQLSRHRPGLLRCHPAVADLPISGVYPLADTDRVLAALTEALPLKITYVTPYWVTVGPR